MITNAKSVDEEPHVTLTEWLIIRPEDTGHLHLIGRKPDGKGRITTAIVDLDLTSMTGRTESGRLYKLSGGQARDHMPAAVVIAKLWGAHMIGKVAAVTPEAAVMMLPARGMA